MTLERTRTLATVAARGWALWRSATSDPLDTIALAFGEPRSSAKGRPVVDILRPTSRDAAPKRSLSARFGRQAFPFHTDLAHHPVPPRFVLLRCRRAASSSVPTLLIDGLRALLECRHAEVFRRDVWLVSGGRGRFYTTIVRWMPPEKAWIVRYDPVCMRPALESFAQSAALLDQAINEAEVAEVEWAPGSLLLFDNWRMLHSRPAVPDTEVDDRLLERCAVWP